MTRYDQTSSRCWVFTFKEGLLSPIAHDLRLAVTRFWIEVGADVSASFDMTSLVVDTPMKDGQENPSALSDADKATIAGQIRDGVLHSVSYPQAKFHSSQHVLRADGGYDLRGELSLHGVAKVIDAHTNLRSGRQHFAFSLDQPDFGIAPYRAMLGTLKIQRNVRIEIVA